MITENCQGPFAAKEDEVVLLARPTANGPQGLELRRDRIDHHTAVRVAQHSPRALRLECSVAYDKSDILGRTSWHIERDIFVIAVPVPTRVSHDASREPDFQASTNTAPHCPPGTPITRKGMRYSVAEVHKR